MHVLLAAQLADLEHHLVGELAEHAAVVDALQVPARLDGPPEVELALAEQFRRPGVRRLDLVGADDAHWHDGSTGTQRQSGDAGPALVETTVAATGAFGVDAEQATGLEDLGRGVERLLARRTT